MKKLLFCSAFFLGGMTCFAQTNTFPSSGDVGIGVTPSYKLDVYKSGTGSGLRVSGSATGTRNDTGIDFGATNGPLVNYARIGLEIYDGTAGSERGGLTFSTIFGGTLSEKMYISGAGDVGIGTTNPREKLSVNGNVRAKQITVETTNWPDYVFDPGHRLQSLIEVKKYIDQYHHLPEMPSEEEVYKNGLNIGEINKLLTKKVEELTLYLIEQNKQMEQLKQEQNERISSLEKALSKFLKSDQ